MTSPVELFGSMDIPSAIGLISLAQPSMTRLEPQSVSGDPSHGADAVIADPLWMIGRQWQLGELLGEDAGSPVSVRVTSRALPITAWAPAGRGDGSDAPVTAPQWRPWPAGAVLDELVEHVPREAGGGLRWRAETGAQLAEALAEAGHGDVAEQLLAAHPLTPPDDSNDSDGKLDPAAGRLLLTLGGSVPDGDAAREALAAGEPAWIAGAGNPAGAGAVAADWLRWVAGAPDAGGAWTTPRLEHRFLLRFGHGDDAVVLGATAFGSGSARWHHFDWLKGTTVDLDGDPDLPPVTPTSDVMLATRLRYPGMPADRYWQLEDASVDVSAIEAQPHDLARLCLAEFALVSGDDWLIVPLDGRVGAVNEVLEVSVTTTFGETLVISEAGSERHGHGFRMFEVTEAGGDTLHGVVLPPIAASPLLGEPVEEVAFLRDEAANMGWAVERVVPGRSGDPRRRSAEPPPLPPAPAAPAATEPDVAYELQVPVPHHWIPLVPVSTGIGVVALRKGAMRSGGKTIEPAGLLLRPTPLTFPAEEIPREGITVQAVPALARRADGSYARWTGYRIRTGRGEGSSGYASDSAEPPRRSTPGT